MIFQKGSFDLHISSYIYRERKLSYSPWGRIMGCYFIPYPNIQYTNITAYRQKYVCL